MTEHKGDDMMVTGAHRAWVGETNSIVRVGARDPQRSWLERAQPAPTAPNSRHAAITRSLHSWTSYKNWTDKVRNSWDKDKNGK